MRCHSWILGAFLLLCQPLCAQDAPVCIPASEAREAIQRLGELQDCRARVPELEAALAKAEELRERERELERRGRELDAKAAALDLRAKQIELDAARAESAAKDVRIADLERIVKLLAPKKRKFFAWGPIPCFWICKGGGVIP